MQALGHLHHLRVVKGAERLRFTIEAEPELRLKAPDIDAFARAVNLPVSWLLQDRIGKIIWRLVEVHLVST